MDGLFELILEDVSAPEIDESCLFRMLATTLERDPYFGRIMSGCVRPNMPVRDGRILERSRTTRVLAVRELEREALEEGCAGDIIAHSGLSVATIADPDNRRSLL